MPMDWNREEVAKGLALEALITALRQVVCRRNMMFYFVECEKLSRFSMLEGRSDLSWRSVEAADGAIRCRDWLERASQGVS